MTTQSPGPYKGNFPSNDNEWVIEARRKNRHFSSIKELLDRQTGGILNAGQLHMEALGILIFLLKETFMFEKMSEGETTQTLIRFSNEYLSLRDKEMYTGLDFFEVKSIEFKKCHLRLLRAVNNSINRKIKPEPFHLTLEKS